MRTLVKLLILALIVESCSSDNIETSYVKESDIIEKGIEDAKK